MLRPGKSRDTLRPVSPAAAEKGGFEERHFLVTRRSLLAATGVLLALCVYASLPGTGPWARRLISGVQVLYANRNSSPDSRGAALLGDAYSLMRQVERTTPKDSRILIPAGPAYDPISNRVWSAYYLYPRTVVQETTPGAEALGRADYVVVYRGSYLKQAGLPEDSTLSAILDVATLKDINFRGNRTR